MFDFDLFEVAKPKFPVRRRISLLLNLIPSYEK